MVRDMVDFPMPALPHSQKILLPCGSAAQLLISLSSCVRVPSRHFAGPPSADESYVASLAVLSFDRSALLLESAMAQIRVR